MGFVKDVANNEGYCHDCKKRIKIHGNSIKDGVMLVYEGDHEKFPVFKCNECYEKNSSLSNYQQCEVYSRIVGYLRPVQQWNIGKREEYKERKEYKEPEMVYQK